MWIILFAILLLCLLVFINKKSEGFTASHALDIYTILMDQKTDSDEKIKKLLANIASVNDKTMEDIINAKPEHVNNTRIIDFNTFFHILKIMQGNEFDQDEEKILEIKKLTPFDDQFDAVLNNTDIVVKPVVKKGDPEPQPPTPLQKLQDLVNEIIYP